MYDNEDTFSNLIATSSFLLLPTNFSMELTSETNFTIPSGNQLFPVFLKLEHLHVLIVGGGYVGFEKISAVLTNCFKTRITLVGIQISEEIRNFVKDYPNVTLIQRPFEIADLNQKNIVLVATNNKLMNINIKRRASMQRILCNVADTPTFCDFYLSSIVQKGDLKIAISTNGKSPTVAKRLKETFNTFIPDELNTILTNMTHIRETLTGDFAAKVKALDKVTSVMAAEAEKPKKANGFWKHIFGK